MALTGAKPDATTSTLALVTRGSPVGPVWRFALRASATLLENCEDSLGVVEVAAVPDVSD